MIYKTYALLFMFALCMIIKGNNAPNADFNVRSTNESSSTQVLQPQTVAQSLSGLATSKKKVQETDTASPK